MPSGIYNTGLSLLLHINLLGSHPGCEAVHGTHVIHT